MSLDAQDWVWEHSRAKGTARTVLLAIADKASGPDCSAYAGTTMLVQRANAARSSVVAAVDKLLASGELEIVPGRTGPRGETRYRLPGAIGHTRQDFSTGGPESGPVQNPDRSENRTPGGPESVPPRSENRTPRGPKSGPHNAVNAVKRRENAEREGARERQGTHPGVPAPVALSLIPPEWQPSPADVQAAQAARMAAGQPTLTGAQLADVTRKLVRRCRADQRPAPAGGWGARWQEWAERERPTDTGQASLLMGLPGGLDLRWPHEMPRSTHPLQPPWQTCPDLDCGRPYRGEEPGLCRGCRERQLNTA